MVGGRPPWSVADRRGRWLTAVAGEGDDVMHEGVEIFDHGRNFERVMTSCTRVMTSCTKGGTWKGRSIVHDPRRDQSKITAIQGPWPAIMITRGHDLIDSCADHPSAPRRIGNIPPALRCDYTHIGPRNVGPVDPGPAELPHPAATWWK